MTDLTREYFQTLMTGLGPDFSHEKVLAVALSGGPDSMALARSLSLWAGPSLKLHVLCVDHGLRPESMQEAADVVARVSGWPGVSATILRWAPTEKVEARIQEEARDARYGLMADYCEAHGISYLFLAHHQDDQAETLLFRLAKGTGLDGLAAMAPLQDYKGRLTLVRPFLDVPKEALVDFCAAEKVEFASDPSNDSEKFARVRLRKARAILEEEGLTSSRLSTTAKRLARAREALDFISNSVYEEALIESDTKHSVFKFDVVELQPEEIVIRFVLRAMNVIAPFEDYAPRLEKVEALVADLLHEEAFRKRTLGGVIFERDDRQHQLILSRERKA